jgi:hypothetical protein
MEALIVALFALFAIVLLDAVYWIAVSLARSAPVIAAGALVGWIASHHGAAPLEALALGLLTCLLARHLLRPRWRFEHYDGHWR